MLGWLGVRGGWRRIPRRPLAGTRRLGARLDGDDVAGRDADIATTLQAAQDEYNAGN